MKKTPVLLPFISLAVLALLLFLLLGQWDLSSFTSKFWDSETALEVIEEELHHLAILNTAEYRMRLIFPYDFIQGQVDWVQYKSLWDYNQDGFKLRTDPAEYVDGKLPELWQNALFYKECKEAGIDPFEFRYDFLVLSVVVKAGTDMETLGFGQNMDLPEPVITDLIFEDLDHSQWGYPDPPVSPDELRGILQFLTPYIEDIALKEGILTQAQEKRDRLIESFLKQAGYGEILKTRENDL